MRFIELALALLLLMILSPLLIIVSIIIKISSPGPILFKPKRIGYKGGAFTLYKFRSMYLNSGEIRVTTLKDDNRVYPFGRFIRNTKIDELPQLINIIIGDMSFIGPRPEDEKVYEKYFIGKYLKIYSVKPGLSSPASLYDFTHGEMHKDSKDYVENFLYKKLELELYYSKNKNIAYDMKIFFKTIYIIILKIFGINQFSPPKEMRYIGENHERI
ncbi:MAG: sugar transferase [Ignavibacteriaceae bacterium]